MRVHAAVAQALEEAGGNLDERAAEMAQHCEEAGDAAAAARWHRRAASGPGSPTRAKGCDTGAGCASSRPAWRT